MKINNQQIVIPDIEIENIEDELVMYSQVSKKIIVFNKSASLIWNIVKESYDKNFDITIDHLCDKIIKYYDIDEADKQKICDDVQAIINQFFEENILVKN